MLCVLTLSHYSTAKAIEYMIIDALKAADPFLKIADRIWDPKKFLYLTDNILETIESSTEPVRFSAPSKQ